jgi:HEAT repeats
MESAMKRWFWKRWAWTGVFGITAAVGLALGAGKDAPPSAGAPPKIGDVLTLKFQNGPEKHVKVLKTERRADGSYQSEVKDMKSGEVFTLIDKSHEPPAAAKTPAPSAAPAALAGKTAPSKPSFIPKGIDSKITVPQPKGIDTPLAIPQPKPSTMKGSVTDFSPSAKTQFTDPLLAEVGGREPDAGRERKLFAPSKPNTVAAPAPMPEPAPEMQKRPGFFKRLFGKDTPPPAMSAPTFAPPNAAPVITPKPVTTAKPKPTPAFMPPNSVFDSGPSALPRSNSAPALMPADTALEPGAGATQPAPRLSAGTATVRTPRVFPARTTTPAEAPRGATSKPNVGSTLLPTPDRTPEPPRTAPSIVTPPMAAVPVPVAPPTMPPTAAPAPLPIPTPPATIPPPVVQAPKTIAPLTPAPITAAPSVPEPPALPAVPVPTAPSPVVPAIPNVPALPTIPAVPGGMSANHAPVMQAGFVSSAAAALAHDIQPHVTALRTAAAPSMRVMAAKALAGGRHASSDAVKSILFIACTTDPSPFVRACCIDELCKLGYYDPAFVVHLNKACGDPSEDVRTAAKDALKKMTPER